MNTIRKAEFIDRVYTQVGNDMTKRDVTMVVETVFEEVAKILAEKERFVYPGLGTFETKERKARMARNPRTGESVEVPAKTVAVFKPSGALKDLVN